VSAENRRTTDAVRAELEAERDGLDDDLAGLESEARRAGRAAAVAVAALGVAVALARVCSRRRR
jgi:hypothetical protein